MVIKVNSLDNEYIISMKKRLESYFDKVKRLNNPELDKIILQGKKNQKVVLFWVNSN